MKTALHSVSYAGLWGQARLSLPDFLHKARTLGFSAVMLMAKRPHLSVLDCGPEELTALRSLLAELKLEVVCLAGYTDFGLGAERAEIPMREMQLLYVRELSRLARELDCKLIRIFTAYDHPQTPPDQQWAKCVDILRE
jgi:sugar phosphate isomerase/epimerase